MDDRTHQLAQIFRAMANLLASQRANPYRVRAYRKAADSILTVTGDLADLAARHQLQEIPGIGRIGCIQCSINWSLYRIFMV